MGVAVGSGVLVGVAVAAKVGVWSGVIVGVFVAHPKITNRTKSRPIKLPSLMCGPRSFCGMRNIYHNKRSEAKWRSVVIRGQVDVVVMPARGLGFEVIYEIGRQHERAIVVGCRAVENENIVHVRLAMNGERWLLRIGL